MISGDNFNGAMASSLISRWDAQDGSGIKHELRRCDMLVRPRDLADRMSGNKQPEIFTLPIDAARCKAREIIDQFPQSGIIPIVENWRQLPDGRIEFTMRHLPTAD